MSWVTGGFLTALTGVDAVHGRISQVAAPRSRAEQKRHTRALIVEAGRRAVASRGFSGLIVRELAREAGLVPTAFYRHFESVDDLASELATGAADGLGLLVDDLVAAPGDPAVDWPGVAVDAAIRDGRTWEVLARGLVDTAHPDHQVLAGAVDSARRRLGITLGRLDALSRADDTAVDNAADLVVVVLIRVLVEVSVGHDARTVAEEGTGRLRIILAGAAATP